MSVYPVSLNKDEARQKLIISWSDNQQREYGYRELQERCPCATCREKRRQPKQEGVLPILKPEETLPLRLVSMSPVGTYAYHIRFNQGCDSGIYTFELLREIGSVTSA